MGVLRFKYKDRVNRLCFYIPLARLFVWVATIRSVTTQYLYITVPLLSDAPVKKS